MEQIKLAAFDVDGTLFDEVKKEYPGSAVESLRKLNENGIMVVLVTGRPPHSARTIEAHGVRIDGFVCCNGHLVFSDEDNIIADERFSAALADEVWNYCKEHDIGLMWKYPDQAAV
ncbi:MAG: HAD hydrolase family protein [Erysipelotrichaceae bacterium]|nr:HAD hydrolase family protein [Erysipelotrichaceae bacterium]